MLFFSAWLNVSRIWTLRTCKFFFKPLHFSALSVCSTLLHMTCWYIFFLSNMNMLKKIYIKYTKEKSMYSITVCQGPYRSICRRLNFFPIICMNNPKTNIDIQTYFRMLINCYHCVLMYAQNLLFIRLLSILSTPTDYVSHEPDFILVP